MCVACLHSDRLSQNNNAKRGAGPLFHFQVDSCLDRFHREPTKPRGGQIRRVFVFPALQVCVCVCVCRVLPKKAGKLKQVDKEQWFSLWCVHLISVAYESVCFSRSVRNKLLTRRLSTFPL